MGIQYSLAPLLFVLISLLAQTRQIIAAVYAKNLFNRHSFPEDFIFGTASAAYQYEGAANKSGRGPSIWDTFTHTYPERIQDGSNGDVADDFYNRYKGDVKIMKEMNTDAFRFSISWSRLLPSGKLSGGVNEEGIRFYNNLIDELLSNGLVPFVTIFHWDVPQALEDEYGGFLSSGIVDDFQNFAELCFREFGDRVKHWITLNEPSMFSWRGYDTGDFAPGRCSKWVSEACEAGDSATEPYIVGHNLILSHAATVKLYKKKYQATQKGKIGATLTLNWLIPYSKSKADAEACQRGVDFSLGWYLNPLVYGEYPFSMRHLVGERLPKFTEEQSKMVKGSFDFIGINYYTTYYGINVPVPNTVNISYSTDALVTATPTRRGVNIGPQAGTSWLYEYPKGLREILVYIRRYYYNPTVYITENGVCENNNVTGLPLEQALKDPARIRYHYRHLLFLLRAIKGGSNVKGYFAWSLLDNFEWNSGYTMRFGINYVDRNDSLRRHPKQSALWFRDFLQK